MLSPVQRSVRDGFAVPSIDPGDLQRAADILRARAGIVLGRHKGEMLARTLGNRVRHHGLRDVAEYLQRLQNNFLWSEWEFFINAFTVNHTAFFRENHHFDMLADFLRGRARPHEVWCCAASTGEEAYSIAMTLHDAALPSDSQALVWATDIDTGAIQQAERGTYPLERVAPVPQEYLRRHFYRGTGAQAGRVRVKPHIRRMIRFEPFNLLSADWPSDRRFDAIFCRNTLIYFDKPTQVRILERFAPRLKQDGLLFVGHSESFTSLTRVFRLRGQTVYVKAA